MTPAAAPAETASPTPVGAPASVLASSQDRALGEMRAFLARSAFNSPSEALRLLRNAYPDAPLSLRVAACGLGDR